MATGIVASAVASKADADFFRHRGFLVIPQLLEPALAAFFWSYAHTKFASLLLDPGDPQVPNTPVSYGDPAFDGLLEYLRPRVEEHSGLRLLPTYSYFRLYKRGDVLRRHRDRKACEISVSLNIGQRPVAPWPLSVESERESYTALQSPGDGFLYRGIICSIGVTPIKAKRWSRCSCIMSIATGRMPTKNSTVGRRSCARRWTLLAGMRIRDRK